MFSSLLHSFSLNVMKFLSSTGILVISSSFLCRTMISKIGSVHHRKHLSLISTSFDLVSISK